MARRSQSQAVTPRWIKQYQHLRSELPFNYCGNFGSYANGGTVGSEVARIGESATVEEKTVKILAIGKLRGGEYVLV